jgi:general stress protein YciG
MPEFDDKKTTPEPQTGRTEGQTPGTPPTGGEGTTRKARKRSKGAGGGMTVAEAGRKGGQAVRDKYGPGFYEAIGKKGGEAVKAERGHAFYEEIGKKGGEAVKAERGHAFYEEIGKKGGESVKASRGSGFYEEIGKRGGHRVRELINEAKQGEHPETGGEEEAPDHT